MLARLDPRRLARVVVPARHADEVRDARRSGRGRARRRRHALRARRRASSRAATTGRSSSGTALQPRRVRSSTRRRRGRRQHDGYWRFTPGQRRGLGVSAREPLYAIETRRPDEHGRGRPARVACAAHRHGARPALRTGDDTSRRSCAIARLRWARAWSETATGFRLHLDEPAYGVARGQAAVLYDGDVVVGSGLVTSATRLG